jgi:hypothetical protein
VLRRERSRTRLRRLSPTFPTNRRPVSTLLSKARGRAARGLWSFEWTHRDPGRIVPRFQCCRSGKRAKISFNLPLQATWPRLGLNRPCVVERLFSELFSASSSSACILSAGSSPFKQRLPCTIGPCPPFLLSRDPQVLQLL